MRPCETCTGECCKRYFVNLSGFDVWKIATALQMSPSQFAVLAQEEEPSPVGFRLDSTKTTFSLVLDKRPGPDGVQQCIFLMNLSGGCGRCGIYPHRPAACRVFPAHLYHGAVAFRDNIVCPDGSWNIAGIDLPAWRKALLRSHMEWAIYAAVVSRWNEQARQTPRDETRTPAQYYTFLLDRYDRLAALERELTDRDMEQVVTGWGQRDRAESGAPAWEQFFGKIEATLAS